MKKSLFYFFLFTFAATTWTACGDDDIEEPPNEEELITTVRVALTSPTDAVTLTFTDLDGEGGDDPVITGGTLDANSTYSYSVTFMNEAESPAEDITAEVQDESLEHFVSLTGVGLDVDIDITDVDSDGNPLGLTGTVTTRDAGSGELRLILLHEPIKTSTNATGGSTDADVSFPVTVE